MYKNRIVKHYMAKRKQSTKVHEDDADEIPFIIYDSQISETSNTFRLVEEYDLNKTRHRIDAIELLRTFEIKELDILAFFYSEVLYEDLVDDLYLDGEFIGRTPNSLSIKYQHFISGIKVNIKDRHVIENVEGN